MHSPHRRPFRKCNFRISDYHVSSSMSSMGMLSFSQGIRKSATKGAYPFGLGLGAKYHFGYLNAKICHSTEGPNSISSSVACVFIGQFFAQTHPFVGIKIALHQGSAYGASLSDPILPSLAASFPEGFYGKRTNLRMR